MPAPATPTILAHEQLTSDASSYNSLSVNPTSGRQILVFAFAGTAAADVNLTSISGWSATWTLIRKTSLGVNPRKGWLYSTTSNGTSGALTLTFDQTCTECHYIILQGGSDWDASRPYLQPRAKLHNASFETTGSITMAGFKDATNNAVLVFGAIGQNELPALVNAEAGYTMLSEQGGALGGQFATLAEWNTGEDLSPSFSWTSAAHYAVIALEVRAPGVTGGIIWDEWLSANGDSTDRANGSPYVTDSISLEAGDEAWIFIQAERNGAQPSDPASVTGLSLTWSKVTSVGFQSVASPTRTFWCYRARASSGTSGTISIDPAAGQTWRSCSWSIYRTQNSHASAPVKQTKTNNANASSSPITATFDVSATEAVLTGFATSASNQTGSPESGYVYGGRGLAANIGMSTEAAGRHTPESSPTWTPSTTVAQAIIAIEIAEAVAVATDAPVIVGLNAGIG